MAFWNKNKKQKTETPVIPVTPINPATPPDSYTPSVLKDSVIYDMPAGIPHQDFSPPVLNASKNSGWEDFISPPPHNDVQVGGWTPTYPLVFFLMENNVCTRKIEFTCYGYERPDDILQRMISRGELTERKNFAYRVLYWPTWNGMSTVDHFDYSPPKMVQDFNPEAGKVFIIEQYRNIEEPEPMYTLYGCPTAALPEQENILKERCVDVLTFE